MRGPSVIDIAKVCGVSPQTVSRVINGHPSVRDSTRARVRAALDELGYTPNRAARALVTGRTGTIGVVSYDVTYFGPASVLHAVQGAARARGYAVHVATASSITAAAIAEVIQEVSRYGVDGIVVDTPQLVAEPLLDLPPRTPPLVFVTSLGSPSKPAVGIDDVTGVRRLLEHLIELGHTRIAQISGSKGWFDADGRVTVWRDVLHQHGLRNDLLWRGDWTPQSGYDAARDILETSDATAIFAANDSMALGAYKAAADAGRKLPRDLSIVGYDDSPESPYLMPGLTSVNQNFHALGELCMETLIRLVEQHIAPDERLLVTPTLRVRGSSAPPRPQG
ncbi:MAG: LacI family DNA-binding transcriptional regulator [Candidatus Nanopelagicales bacterium]